METKLNYKRTFLIGLAFLSICSFWQMYDNIIPLILQNTYHLGETMTGAVMALDNVLAIFLLAVCCQTRYIRSLAEECHLSWQVRSWQ